MGLFWAKNRGCIVCLDNTSPFFKAFLGQKIETRMLFSKCVSFLIIKINP
nr:MAG TPA: hypothetical protein [Caudoviricetes sp.]